MANDTIRRFSLRVRTTEGDSDSLRDFLHEDRASSFSFRSFAEANAQAEAEVAAFCDDWGFVSWEKKNEYDENDGGGFWFVLRGEDGDETEGRVCVVFADFVL
jgi:hypothetical protein